MQRIIIIFAIVTAIAVLASDSNAQAKKRISLSKGADSIKVQGSISGARYVLYEIWVDKGDEWSVYLDSANKYIGYTVKSPNGNRYDFLEPSPAAGYYQIRIELNSKGSHSKKLANFSLNIKFKIEPVGSSV